MVSDTGIAGLTLGGGEGWVRRKHGLSVDNLLSAQVVCADGQVRTASADSNPDLFWAIRGGGGNFGVVTSFTFQCHPVGPMVAFAGVFHPVEDAENVYRQFRDWAKHGAGRDLGADRMHDAAGKRAHAAGDPQHAVHRHRRCLLR